MRSKRELSRRHVVRLTGTVGLGVAGAGCIDDVDETGAGADESSETDPGSDDTDSGSEEGDDESADDLDDEAGDASSGDEEVVEGAEYAVPSGTTIVFDVQSTGWVGVAPSKIEGEANPTLVLEEGGAYEIGWVGDDGATHNVELRAEDGTVVDDLATGDTSEPNDRQRLEFEASEELASYVCGTHDGAMRGEIIVDGEADGRDGDEGEQTDDRYEIAPGESITLDGVTSGWVGIAPSEIEGEANPTLVLEEGAEYEIGWVDSDGMSHNVELRDEGDEVVDDYTTELTDDPGDDQFLEFEASRELAYYVCHPHEAVMRGRIHVE
ncbi:plastocyanin/azurin family copper-binding protein [Natronococcus pandeyae]|nr:plastocyanin/azurin family copper-binding protein [Natronococcus pandeyae]